MRPALPASCLRGDHRLKQSNENKVHPNPLTFFPAHLPLSNLPLPALPPARCRRFKESKENEVLCSQHLNTEQIESFRAAVSEDYYFQVGAVGWRGMA